jgi:Photosynthetic reaction centre cytochrome C subunit
MKVFIAIISILTIIFFSSMKIDARADTYGIYQDSLQVDRNKYINELKEKIKGREQMAVDSVFKNLKVFGGFPAENLLIAMNSWSRALGVSCNHCHETSNWALDSNPKKDIARQMSEMTTKINKDFLRNIKGLSNERHIINCTSCHNGKLKPALRIND